MIAGKERSKDMAKDKKLNVQNSLKQNNWPNLRRSLRFKSSICSFLGEQIDNTSTDYSLWKTSKRFKLSIVSIPQLEKMENGLRIATKKLICMLNIWKEYFNHLKIVKKLIIDQRMRLPERPVVPVSSKKKQREVKINLNNKTPEFDLISEEK